MTNNIEFGYLQLLRDLLEKGIYRDDRTGTGTYSLFGYQLRHDLSLGFPLLTTKKVFFKGVVHELLWFMRGETNIKYLVDNGVHIWDEWADSNGDLQNVYGAQWRRWELDQTKPHKIIPIDVRLKTKPEILKTKFFDTLQDGVNDNEFVGKKFVNKKGLDYRVIKKIATKRNSSYTIQFKESGYTAIVSRPNLKQNEVEDRYNRSIFGIGYVGQKLNKKNYPYYSKARALWYNILARCYDKNNMAYIYYGNKGIFMDERWHDFSVFLSDLTQIPFFNHWKNGLKYELDKDYYGSNNYSNKTCVFLQSNNNKKINAQKDKLKVAKNIATGKETIFITSKNLNITYPTIKFIDDAIRSSCKTGKPYKGFEFSYHNKNNDISYREEYLIDQLQNVVDSIKNNPNSRRHMVVAWNPGEVDNMALPPCHCLFQFYVADGKLSCQLYQRSADVFLGVPFNIASYALLTHLVANVCGLKVGYFVHTFGDIHLYANHIEQTKQQLLNDPMPLPTIKIKPNILGISDFTYEDIELIGYNSHPAIKAPIAV